MNPDCMLKLLLTIVHFFLDSCCKLIENKINLKLYYTFIVLAHLFRVFTFDCDWLIFDFVLFPFFSEMSSI